MKKTLRFPLILFMSLLFCGITNYAQHTFSIVAVDTATGEIGSAGATCIGAEDGALAISDIVLGVGAIHTQAFYVPTNQNNARARMVAGDSPQEIIDWLVANDVSGNPAIRQYGVVDLNGGAPRSAAHTGSSTDDVKLHITGPNYAIQGNILISADVINDMETAFNATSGTLADKLMAALQGAKRPGADSRCLPFNISSASAFLRVADPSDTDSSYGNLSLDLNVWTTDGSFEPIDQLQLAYDATLSISDHETTPTIAIFPNPSSGQVTIRTNGTMVNAYEIVDVSGKLMTKRSITSPQNNVHLSVANYPKGVYFISIYDGGKKVATEKLIVQ